MASSETKCTIVLDAINIGPTISPKVNERKVAKIIFGQQSTIKANIIIIIPPKIRQKNIIKNKGMIKRRKTVFKKKEAKKQRRKNH